MSDLYQRKVSRARQALEQTENARSIVKNLDKALNYQKSLSVNAHSKLAKGKNRGTSIFLIISFENFSLPVE